MRNQIPVPRSDQEKEELALELLEKINPDGNWHTRCELKRKLATRAAAVLAERKLVEAVQIRESGIDARASFTQKLVGELVACGRRVSKSATASLPEYIAALDSLALAVVNLRSYCFSTEFTHITAAHAAANKKA